MMWCHFQKNGLIINRVNELETTITNWQQLAKSAFLMKLPAQIDSATLDQPLGRAGFWLGKLWQELKQLVCSQFCIQLHKFGDVQCCVKSDEFVVETE